MANTIEQLNVVDYSRQSALDALMTPKMSKSDVNIIVGCGGIGFWLGLQLAMLGYRHFILIDGQNVDYSNLNRLPVPQSWVGVNKAVALRKIIRSMRLDTIVLAVSTHVAKDTMSILKNATGRFKAMDMHYYGQGRATLWDTTDDAKIQNELCKYAKEVQGLEYRKLGYEGFEIGCYKDYSVWTPEEYTTGYRTSNANAVTSAISAGMGIFARCLTEQDMQIDLKSTIQKTQKSFKGSDEIKRLEKIIAVYRGWVNSDEHDDIDQRLTEQGLI
jgi:hypothetical protein